MRHDQVGARVVNRPLQENNSVLEQPAIDVKNPLFTAAALNDIGYEGHDYWLRDDPGFADRVRQRLKPFRREKVDAWVEGGHIELSRSDFAQLDPGVALTRTLKGQDDYDFQQPPPDRLGTLQSKYSSQVKVYTPANTYYFFMNNRVKPFNDVRVRQAVNYAINRQALVRVYGGLANPTENILPPTYPQYKKHTLYPYNLAKAKKLIQQAGVKGMAVTVWNHDRGQDPKATAYLTDVLNSIGFKAKEKIINSSVYWTTIGNQSTKAQIGFADWFQDYPHPLDWFDVLLNGTRITPTHNNNYSNFDNKAVNTKIAALKKQTTLTSSVNDQWAALDKQVMQQAAWAPFINRQFVDTFNSDIDLGCYVNHLLYQFDFATICHK